MRFDLKGGILAMFAVLFTLIALEAGLSWWGTHRVAVAERRPDAPMFILRDPALGWRAMPNRNLPLGAGGHFTTDARGWRRYDVPASKPLWLVLGDSFTHAVGVPDGSVYYDVVARRLGLAIVALGVNGYGTVQELMAARLTGRDIPEPAGILIQLANNDPINNSFALERKSFTNNNLLPRPYLDEAGGIQIRDPRRIHEHLVLGRELTRGFLAGHAPTVESAIEAGDPEALMLYHRELAHTALALRLLRRLFPNSHAVAFDAGGSDSRIGRDLERLAREAGFDYIDIGPLFSERARQRAVLQADGAHWNEVGHNIAGLILAEALAHEPVTRAGRP